jgi:hypothetical protein
MESAGDGSAPGYESDTARAGVSRISDYSGGAVS